MNKRLWIEFCAEPKGVLYALVLFCMLAPAVGMAAAGRRPLKTIKITASNLGSFFQTGTLRLSCYSPKRLLGRARPALAPGARFRVFRHKIELRVLKQAARAAPANRRKAIKRKILSLRAAAAACHSSAASKPCTAYVDRVSPSCSDSNPGSPSQPYCTIGKAVQVSAAGSVVCVKSGVYREALTFAHSGTAAEPIVIKANPGEGCKDVPGAEHKQCSVVLDGATPLTGPWTRYSGSIYYTELPEGLVHEMGRDSVFQDNTRLRYATTPNQDTTYFNYGRYNEAREMTSTSLTDANTITAPDGFWAGAWLKFRDISSSHRIRRILSQQAGTLTYAPLDLQLADLDSSKYTYIITNHLGTLDAPGEFVIDYDSSPKRLYLIPTDSSSPETHEISISTLATAFLDSYYVGLKSNLRIEGLEIRKYRGDAIFLQDYYHSEAENIAVVNNFIHNNGDSEGLFYIGGTGIGAANVRGLLVENNEIFANGGTAVGLGGKDGTTGAVIRGNNIHYNGADGVHGEGRDLLIEGNRIYNQFHTDGHQDALDLYTVDGTLNWVIRNNVIFDTTQNIYFGSPGWFSGMNSEQVEIYGNVVYNKDYPGRGKAIYFGSSGTNYLRKVYIHSNTLAFQGFIMGGLIDDIVVRNNILYQSGYGVTIDPSITAPRITSDYNIFFNTAIAWPYLTWYTGEKSFHAAHPDQELHSSWEDPKLLAPYQYDFSLTASSGAAIDRGDPNLSSLIPPLPSAYADRNGTKRLKSGPFDIGALEYVSQVQLK